MKKFSERIHPTNRAIRTLAIAVLFLGSAYSGLPQTNPPGGRISRANAGESLSWREKPPIGLCRGDVVLRRGRGVWTRHFIAKASREKRFSHIGIVTAVTNGTTILHSEASDFTGIGDVHESTWRSFFEDSLECAVFRCRYGEAAARAVASQAERYRGVPFDPLFDTDSTNRLYCTEFVRQAVNEGLGTNLVGTTVVDGRRIITFDDVYQEGFDRVYDSLGSGRPAVPR